jgi:tetratricopeptide (TPR) repeat protein
LIRTIPFAARRAESHLNKAAEVARAIGAKGVLGQAYLDLGKLRKRLGKPDEAKKFITDAISLFETCGADSFLRQAREFLGFP